MVKSGKKFIILAVMALAMVTLILSGCGQPAPAPAPTTSPAPAPTATAKPELTGTFSVTGSNTVTPITSIWAEDFMKANQKVNIAVSGPGSGAGIAALINGTTDVCQSSRLITDKEIEQAKAKGVNPYEILVASDALSVVVHPSNPVSEITIAQLSAIYAGQITNWKEVGGKDAPIVALSRDTNSGTHVFFKEHVVQMYGLPTADKKLEYGSKVLFLPSTEGGVTEASSNPNAIFYPGLGYLTDKVKALAIKKDAGAPAVMPSVKTSLDGTYPISRPLVYYTNGAPAGVIKAFIDFCLSEKGQQDVLDAGFVPIK